MNLKHYNPETLPTGRGAHGLPRVNITRVGRFSFNKPAMQLLSIGDNDQVEFYQDEGDPQNWYISKVDKGGFVLKAKIGNGNELVFYKKALAEVILESVDVKLTKPSVSLPIAGEPTKLGKQTLFGILAIAAKR